MVTMISIKLSTSEIAGTPSKVTMPSAKIIAGIKATTLFFAPLIVTSPFKGRPPFITIFLILFLSQAFSYIEFLSIISQIPVFAYSFHKPEILKREKTLSSLLNNS